MNRSKALNTFALLAFIILSTVGGVIFLGLQLAPIARDIMGHGITSSDVPSSPIFPSVNVSATSSPTVDAILRSTPLVQMEARNAPAFKPEAVDSAASPVDTSTAGVDGDVQDVQDALADTATFASDNGSAAGSGTAQSTASNPATATDPPIQRAVVDAAMINVRSAPSIAGELLTQLPQDVELQILRSSDDGEWVQVCCPLGSAAERESWVSVELLRLLPSSSELFSAGLQATLPNAAGAAAAAQATDANQEAVTGVVNVPLVNIRSGPSTQYEIVGQASAASVLTIIGRGEAGEWVQACCPAAGQQSGWISLQFLDIAGDKEQALHMMPISPIPPLPTASPPPTANALNRATVSQVATGTGAGLPGGGGFGVPGATNPLTGQGLGGGRNGQRPLIVCLNNDPAARPQFGLSQADVVYEYLMEGYGITRFSAIFYGEDVGQIGPVRSARLINYYMGALYDAGLVCSGASDGVRYTLKHEAPFPYLDIDLDDPSNTRYSVSIGTDYRTRLRTSTEGGHRWLSDWGVERPPNLRGFTFGDPIDSGATPAHQVTVPYPSGTGSQVRYQYDAARGQYLRWLGGNPHTDGNSGQQLALDNVIVQYVAHEATDIVEDSLGSTSIRLNLFGSGKALVFRNGMAYVGTWRSDSRGDLPRFYGSDGAEVTLKPGKSWISVVPSTYTIAYQ